MVIATSFPLETILEEVVSLGAVEEVAVELHPAATAVRLAEAPAVEA